MSAFWDACQAFGYIDSFEDYLRRASARALIHHRVVVKQVDSDRVTFSIEPIADEPHVHEGRHANTYQAEGNRLTPARPR